MSRELHPCPPGHHFGLVLSSQMLTLCLGRSLPRHCKPVPRCRFRLPQTHRARCDLSDGGAPWRTRRHRLSFRHRRLDARQSRALRRARNHRGSLHPWRPGAAGRRFSISSAAFRSTPTASGFRSAPTCRSISPISIRSRRSSSACEAPTYSEHLAFTRVPGRDLANLLPLPRTEAVAESIVAKVRTIQSRIPRSVPARKHLLCIRLAGFEHVGCRVSQPDLPRNRRRHPARHREPLSERRAITASTPYAFIDGLSAGLVREVHMAGGINVHDDYLPAAVPRRFPFSSGSGRNARSAGIRTGAARAGDHRARTRRPSRCRRTKSSATSRASGRASIAPKAQASAHGKAAVGSAG